MSKIKKIIHQVAVIAAVVKLAKLITEKVKSPTRRLLLLMLVFMVGMGYSQYRVWQKAKGAEAAAFAFSNESDYTAGETILAESFTTTFGEIQDIINGGVDTDNLASGAVTASKLGTGAVTTTKILNGTVINEDISDSAGITLDKLNLSSAIIMWSGAESAIPDNWALCDGDNGTPDLTDKFIVGAGDTYEVADTGGATTHTHTGGAHTHGSGTLYAKFWAAQAAGVVEFFAYPQTVTPWTTFYHFYTTPVAAYSGTTTSAAPAMGGSTASGGAVATSSGSSLPPYYALCYIMYVGS